jgi:hypothetical protein
MAGAMHGSVLVVVYGFVRDYTSPVSPPAP